MMVALEAINKLLSSQSQLVNSHSQSIAKLEAQVRQIANTLHRRKEGKLPSQLVTNPKRHYMVDANKASTSNLVQIHAITTLRRGRVFGN